jgi:hypothetical protein
MSLYSDAINGIAYWVDVLNDAEKFVGEDKEDQSIYLDKIPVRLSGSTGELVGYLVDEIGGEWSFRFPEAGEE